MKKDIATKAFDAVLINESVLEALYAIQEFAGDYYLRILDETEDCLLAESDMLSDGSESQLRRLKGLRMIRKDIARLAGLDKKPTDSLVHFGLEPDDSDPDSSDPESGDSGDSEPAE